MTAENVISLELARRFSALEDAECGALGSCMLHPERIDEAALHAGHFTDPIRSRMWAIVTSLHAAGHHVGPDSVLTAYLAKHGPFRETRAEQFEYLADLTDLTFTRASTAHYATFLRQDYNRRQAEAIGKQLASDGDIGHALDALQAVQHESEGRWINAPDRLAERLMSLVTQRPKQAVPTGFDDFDRIVGLRPSELAVILARPGHGKTALALNIVTNANVPSLVFSGEQDADAVLLRIAASVGRIPLQRLRVDGITPDDMATLVAIRDWLTGAGITIIDEPSPSLEMIERETRKAVRMHGARMVVVDYLQRMRESGTDDAKWMAVARNITGLKELARRHDLPVVCLAQAGRTCDARSGDDRIPRLDDAQHSSAIEQEADVVLGLYRPRAYEPTSADKSATLRVLKNRQGGRGDIRLVYEGQFVRFETPTQAHYAHPFHDR
jgi:replicative DNA helicase